jgi:hypothetical protein
LKRKTSPTERQLRRVMKQLSKTVPEFFHVVASLTMSAGEQERKAGILFGNAACFRSHPEADSAKNSSPS